MLFDYSFLPLIITDSEYWHGWLNKWRIWWRVNEDHRSEEQWLAVNWLVQILKKNVLSHLTWSLQHIFLQLGGNILPIIGFYLRSLTHEITGCGIRKISSNSVQCSVRTNHPTPALILNPTCEEDNMTLKDDEKSVHSCQKFMWKKMLAQVILQPDNQSMANW